MLKGFVISTRREGRGDSASRNHEALFFPSAGAETQACRLSLRKPAGVAYEKEIPGQCFRESRRHPRAQSKLSSQKQRFKVNEGGHPLKAMKEP
jgi:hypothetical protein